MRTAVPWLAQIDAGLQDLFNRKVPRDAK